MLLVLLPIFFLAAGMAGGGAYFVARFVFPEIHPRQIRRIRNGVLGACLIFPPLLFGLLMLAEPKDQADPPVTADVALIPAIWIGMVLLGIAIGLTRAGKQSLFEPS